MLFEEMQVDSTGKIFEKTVHSRAKRNRAKFEYFVFNKWKEAGNN